MSSLFPNTKGHTSQQLVKLKENLDMEMVAMRKSQHNYKAARKSLPQKTKQIVLSFPSMVSEILSNSLILNSNLDIISMCGRWDLNPLRIIIKTITNTLEFQIGSSSNGLKFIHDD
jgi:hypothetical protein